MKKAVHISIHRQKRGLNAGDEVERIIKTCIRQALKYEQFPYAAEVAVLLTDDEGIRALNREHRGLDRATDVLSFPMFSFQNGQALENLAEEEALSGAVFLGDIVLNVNRARQQGAEYGHGFDRECGFLTVHSMMHLMGYDHERNEEDTCLMREREEAVLQSCGLNR